MAAQWFYLVGGQQLGPVSASELRKLASSGQLDPESLIWKEGLQDWIKARSIKELFPDVSRQIAASERPEPAIRRAQPAPRIRAAKHSTCPYCREQILIGAQKCKHCGEWLGPRDLTLPALSRSSISQERVRNIAVLQKGLMLMILANVISLGLLLFEVETWGIVVAIVVTIFQIIVMYGLARQLRLPSPSMWVIGGFIPCVALFVLLGLNGRATRAIRQAGFHVGLLGANLDEIDGSSQ